VSHLPLQAQVDDQDIGTRMIEAMVRRVTSPVMVGRSEVVAQLEHAARAAIDGQPRHAVISGEAGVGKTRLLAESRVRAEAAGARVLTGGCVSMGGEGLPFAPYTEIIRGLVAQAGAASVIALAGRAAPDLARLVPVLGSGETAREQELWAQTRLYEALLDLFRRLAAAGPLVIQLEDLHWADGGTLAATSHLLGAIQDEPIAVVATFRTDEVTRRHPVRAWLAEVVRDANVERIELPPLDEKDVASLIANITGEQLQDREVAEILARSDGNPFFIEELLCCRTDYEASLPASLRDVLFSRIDAIPDGAKRLLEIASVGGREVEHEMLAAVADGDDEVAAGVRVLVDSGLLVPTRAVDGDDAYSFRHALLREVVYDALLPTERRRLHQRWGEYLSEHVAVDSDDAAGVVQLAYHWRVARDARATAASIAAGDRAMTSFSYEIASSEYGEALLLWDGGSEARSGIDHVELLERSARAAYLASDFRRAVASCREAIDELGDQDPARLTGLLILLARSLWVSGEWGPAIVAYEQALETAPAEPPIVRVKALAGLAQVYMLHSRLLEARPLCEEAIEAARAIGARELEGHGRNTLGVVLAFLGEVDAAMSSIDAALEIGLELGIPDDIGRAYVNKVDMEILCGAPEQALKTADEGMRVAAEWGVSSTYGAYIGWGGVTAGFESGAWDQALEILAQADRMVGSSEAGYVYRASYASELFANRGDARFLPLWERASRSILERPPSDFLGQLFLGGIEHAAFTGDHARAAELAWPIIELLRGVDAGFRLAEIARVASWPMAELGKAARLAGDGTALAAAREHMDRLGAVATRWRQEIAEPSSRLGEMLALDGVQVDAERDRMEGSDRSVQWKDIADAWDRLGRPFRSALARWRQAEAAESAGEREVAAAALREAHRIASELGARPLLDHLEVMARRLRLQLGSKAASAGTAPERAYGLTRREQEVLAEVAAGRTNREIAERLFISESTAGVHVSNILGKLGASTRTEAARVALDQGLVSSSG
jgi:DNA-binding CsgD family transcriptional regulator